MQDGADEFGLREEIRGGLEEDACEICRGKGDFCVKVGSCGHWTQKSCSSVC